MYLKFVVRLAAVLAVLGSVSIQCDEALRNGWYLNGGIGLAQVLDIDQEGWNLDTYCYPDSACFDDGPNTKVSGYRWYYDIALDRGFSFELSGGRFFGRYRLEAGISQRKNDINQVFKDITYYLRSAVLPRQGMPVNSNSRGGIDSQNALTVTLDAFFDFPKALGSLTPYVGVGFGQAFVEVSGVRFSSDYRSSPGFRDIYDPNLAFYNSTQDADLTDTVMSLRLHAGADYQVNRETSVGLRLSWVATGDFEADGDYNAHPMFSVDPNFQNTNSFSGARSWKILGTLRRSVGN